MSISKTGASDDDECDPIELWNAAREVKSDLLIFHEQFSP